MEEDRASPALGLPFQRCQRHELLTSFRTTPFGDLPEVLAPYAGNEEEFLMLPLPFLRLLYRHRCIHCNYYIFYLGYIDFDLRLKSNSCFGFFCQILGFISIIKYIIYRIWSSFLVHGPHFLG